MSNQIPLIVLLASKNPMSIAIRSLIKELTDAADTLELDNEEGKMTERDKDSLAVGFMNGCGFFADIIVEILSMPDERIREAFFKRWMLQVNEERVRLSKEAGEKLDALKAKKGDGK